MNIARATIFLGLLLIGRLSVAETLLVPSDPGAVYTVIEKGGSKRKPWLITKRVDRVGTSYAKRLYDCKAKTTKYLGEGDTLEHVKLEKSVDEMGPVQANSIAFVQYNYVCK